MCPGLLKEKDTVWNLIRPQHYTEFSYLPSPATNNDTTTDTSTTGDVVMIGYIQQFLFFEDKFKEEVLSPVQFIDDVLDEAYTSLIPYITYRNVMVVVHIRGNYS